MHQMVADERATDVQVPAVVFDSLAPDQVVELFVTINAKHTKLNPSHLISLAGRRLYPDKALAASHDIIRTLNEHAESPLHGEIKLFGVGRGRVAQAPLADELKSIFTSLDALGGAQSERFRDAAPRFFLNYFKQIARVFPRAWAGPQVQHQDGDGVARASSPWCPRCSPPSAPPATTSSTRTPSAARSRPGAS